MQRNNFNTHLKNCQAFERTFFNLFLTYEKTKILLENGFSSGPKLGKILSLVYDIQIKNNITSVADALAIAKEISNKVNLQEQ